MAVRTDSRKREDASPHGSSGYFSIADTDSIKPIDKRARKVHVEYTKAAQALDEEYYPNTPAGSRGPTETPTRCDTGPVQPTLA